MSEPLIYVDTSEIRAGKLAEVERRIAELAAFVEDGEPRLVSYAAYLDEQRKRMTVVHVHVDASSLELHMDIGGPRFRAFADLVDVRTIDLYGAVGPLALEQAREKGRALGDATVCTHEPLAGFLRRP